MELNDPHQALSGLIGCRVEDRSGRALGRLFDLQGRVGADGTVTVEQLVVGRGGLWRRLKGEGASGKTLAWEHVTEILPVKVVVAETPVPGTPGS